MKNRFRNWAIVLLATGCAITAVHARDNELTAREKALGWELLFNGRDTEGWANRMRSDLVNWEARDGALTRVAKGGDVVYRAKQFENFEMLVDWKAEGNSGVFVRMSDQKDWLNTGLEIQVLPKTGSGKHAAGALYDLEAPPAEARVKEGDWNRFHIVCDGPIVACSMNGVETFRIDLREEKWKTAQGKFNRPYATLPRRGWIMFQDHGSAVAYKNVKVRPIATAASKEGLTLDPLHAGRDWEVQGEYAGFAGRDPIGAQLVALGDGKFAGVFYVGGLPGSGWNQEDVIRTEGRWAGETLRFSDDQGSVDWSEGRLIGKTSEGDRIRLEKTFRASPTLGAPPPEDAVVLFDGSDADAWQGGRMDERGYLAAGAKSRREFGDHRVHLEFLLPFKPAARGQERGNSGVYAQDRYEVQVLDSFGLEGRDNECGGVYKQAAPQVNMCLPPLSWQTYDIDFTAARFDGAGNKTQNAVITVKHNGVVIHRALRLSGPTGGGKAETPAPGALQLQGHGNPVFFRNVWVVPAKD